MARFQFFRTERNLVQWRLLAGNNRVLGVSIQAFPEHASAFAEVEIIRKHGADADFEVEHTSAGQWWWRLSVADPSSASAPPLAGATSGRGFARRVDALLAVERFRQRASDAEPDWSLAVFQPGRRGREIPVDRSHHPRRLSVTAPD
ncbi:MAG TPA: hypothetical protein VG247_31925 [Pseudonocardiaceae bacterium]|nr:hypothetical protein [Pseudonocardiaceae bacterium]